MRLILKRHFALTPTDPPRLTITHIWGETLVLAFPTDEPAVQTAQLFPGVFAARRCHCRRNFTVEKKTAFHRVKSAVSVARGKYRSQAGSLQMSEKTARGPTARGPSPAKNPIKLSEKGKSNPTKTHTKLPALVWMQHQRWKRRGEGGGALLLGMKLQRSFALW